MSDCSLHLALLGMIAVLCAGYNLVSLYFKSQTYKLRHIPSVGSPGLIGSCFDAFKYSRHAHEIIQAGYNKFYGGIFKVADVRTYHVVVSGPEMIADIRRARDDQLSIGDAISDLIQADYTFGRDIFIDPFHIPVIGISLTRNLAVQFPDLKDEIITAFIDLILLKDTKEWTSICAFEPVMRTVCRTSSRLFVGLPLCRDPEYRRFNEMFTLEVIKGLRTINMFPSILKPIVGRYLTKMPEIKRRGIAHIEPIIQRRLEKERELGPEWAGKPNDLISWILDTAEGPQRSIGGIVDRILAVNFAGTYTTSMAFTHILYDLAAHPEYVPAMREEVEEVIKADGWTKFSQGKMHKVDSFVKESQRIHVPTSFMVLRKALKDFTFSNGIVVPAGTIVSVPAGSVHFDETIYSNPDQFDGFRFSDTEDADKDEADEEGSKYQAASLTDSLTFGTGRHACPGRFLAVNVLKAMLVHVLLTYDVKLKGDHCPEDIWIHGSCSPDPLGELLFRRRV